MPPLFALVALPLSSVFLIGINKPTTVSTPGATETSSANFVDITSRSGITFQYQASHTSRKYPIETMGAGVALLDYDNDGRLDIFLVNGAPLPDPTPRDAIPQKSGPAYWNRLYHQRGDGTFEDVTVKAGLQGAGYGMGVAVGDYNNDGFEDIYVTAYGGNKLYRNNGDGTFSDITQIAGVGGSGWSTSAAWVDLDNDGWLDLVVLRYLDWNFEDIWCGEHKPGGRYYCGPDLFKPVAPLVFHNNRNGTFTEVSERLGISKKGKGLGVAVADYDHDGRVDLFVANDMVPQFLYHNKGDGTFEEVAETAGVALDANGHVFAGMGVNFVDYDNDGKPDLFIVDLANQGYALYRNNGGGSFSYVSENTAIRAMSLAHSGWGTCFLDFDNDGWKDLLVAQGHLMDTIEQLQPNLQYRETMLLAKNTGGRFTEISNVSGAPFQQRWVARGMAIGDLDNDGRVDAVVLTNEGPVHILHNATATQNHWLILELVGHKSNRDGIGAVVTVTTPDSQQTATVSTAGSYLSSSDKRVHFGLGPQGKIQTIEICWPSGVDQVLKNVPADRILKIQEP